ncbi:MAG TPA: FHA domain-containing protein [Coriobacteriia bacterium]|nr:FHA domain-containing protein [Coriobacteriia bacterium]
MTSCPSCGTPLDDPRPRECPVCDVSLGGGTESFAPVAGVDDEEVGAPAGFVTGPALVIRKGPGAGERFFIDRPKLIIGRDPQHDIFLNDVTVSRTHAVLESRASDVTVEDMGSLNGTYVNGVRVERAALRDGDLVHIGRFQMLFVNREEA